MGNRAVITALTFALVMVLGAGASAVDWTYLGTSAFSQSAPMDDAKRIRFGSIAVDDAGNVYAAANNANNSGGLSGGITIFKAGGGKIDIDLDAAGFPGAVTKLVKGGDGAVYGLQNWLEINWNFNSGVPNRIIGIGADGSVTEIYSHAAASDANRIGGMTVGGDGNIYWTQNGADGYWKYHFLWRYDVGQGVVEEAPINNINNGWSETHRMFDLEWIGEDQLAVVKMGNAEWRADLIGWSQNRTVANVSNPGWGRDWTTQLAYDPIRDRLWAGGRGVIAAGSWTFYANGGSAGIVDGAIRITKPAGEQTYYRLNLPSSAVEVSAGARFKLVNYDGGFDGTLVQLRAPGYLPILNVAVSGSNYVLKDQSAQLAVLAPVVADEYNDVHVYLNALTGNIECWWNGVKKYDGTGNQQFTYNWAGALFGAATRDGGSTGTAVADFDWFGCAESRITPDDTWPNTLGYYLDGTFLPQNIRITNIMTRWDNPASQGGSVAWHANNNNPDVSGIPNGGNYWVSALAVDPVTGVAWMSWGAEATYGFDEIGTVWTRDLALNYGSQGIPETGAQVIGLTFANGKVYALTCNLTSKAYNVYEADAPSTIATTVGAAKQGPVGLIFQTGSPKLVTYPDPAESTAFFYIQEDDRSSGIKVIPASGQPVAKLGQRASISGFVGVQNGEAVIYATSVVTQSTSDQIAPMATSVRNIGGNQLGIQPATLSGGSSNWGFPQCLNTTGLLVRVAGKLIIDGSDELIDDGSGFPIRIEFGPGTGYNDGDYVAVTGISGVAWDGLHGFRVIIPRDYYDITRY